MRNPDVSFWKDKKVFLTGHTGFKGSWLTVYLDHLGAKITGYALEPPTNPAMFNVLGLQSLISSVHGDIRNYVLLEEEMRRVQPDIVIHMAAQPLVRESYFNPRETYEVNVIGTLNVFEASRKTESVSAILNITTDKCYENKEWIWPYRETDGLGGYDPYSSSKACSEILTSAFRNSFFSVQDSKVAIASGRAGNVIGGGDWAKDRLIPDYFRSIATGEMLELRNPNAIRPWQHVLEPLTGYLLLIEELMLGGPEFGEPFNFGPNENDCKSVQWICDNLNALIENKEGYKIISGETLHEATFLRLDSSKAKIRLNWEPRWNLNKALQSIVEWQEAWLSGEEMLRFSRKQLQNYIMVNK